MFQRCIYTYLDSAFFSGFDITPVWNYSKLEMAVYWNPSCTAVIFICDDEHGLPLSCVLHIWLCYCYVKMHTCHISAKREARIHFLTLDYTSQNALQPTNMASVKFTVTGLLITHICSTLHTNTVTLFKFSWFCVSLSWFCIAICFCHAFQPVFMSWIYLACRVLCVHLITIYSAPASASSISVTTAMMSTRWMFWQAFY